MTEIGESNEDTKIHEPGIEKSTAQYAGVRISLENVIVPDVVFEESPSHKDGLSKETEDNLRYFGCQFIQTAGILLKVQQVAMATAQVLFQRFYFTKSFVKHKMLETAMACIWLASKVEECPRRVRDVINVFHCLEQKRKKEPVTPMTLDVEYVTTKNNVIKAERRLLKELGFCVHVKHPHKIIVVYLQLLELEKNSQLVQTSWNYMNDSLQTSIFVKYTPETIACACIYLAARVLQVPLPTNPHWFSVFNSEEQDLQDICLSLLKVYQVKPTGYDAVEAEVQKVRDAIQHEKQKLRGDTSDDKVSASANNSPMSNTSIPGGSPYTRDTKNLAKKAVMSGKNRRGSKERGSHFDFHKRTRSRSGSNKNHRQQSSSNSESDSDADRLRKKSRRHGDLPKSYAQHNDDSNERRHRRRKHKSRREEQHKSRKSRHNSRERRYRSEHKKHKRKADKSNGVGNSTLGASIMQNGDKSTKTRKHSRNYRENERKKRAKHSPISPPKP